MEGSTFLACGSFLCSGDSFQCIAACYKLVTNVRLLDAMQNDCAVTLLLHSRTQLTHRCKLHSCLQAFCLKQDIACGWQCARGGMSSRLFPADGHAIPNRNHAEGDAVIMQECIIEAAQCHCVPGCLLHRTRRHH